MVQRWDYESLYPSEDGDWVKYSDYAALLQTLSAARTYVNDAAKTDAHAFGLLQAINKALKND